MLCGPDLQKTLLIVASKRSGDENDCEIRELSTPTSCLDGNNLA
jgi:hypothetical protein